MSNKDNPNNTLNISSSGPLHCCSFCLEYLAIFMSSCFELYYLSLLQDACPDGSTQLSHHETLFYSHPSLYEKICGFTICQLSMLPTRCKGHGGKRLAHSCHWQHSIWHILSMPWKMGGVRHSNSSFVFHQLSDLE